MSDSTTIPRVDSDKLVLIRHITAALPGYVAAMATAIVPCPPEGHTGGRP
ncbi:hypothetical protein [uncultured Thiodictyon sp.]|nr:hypothetical protein [uncultured Thiodictyon sp.]